MIQRRGTFEWLARHMDLEDVRAVEVDHARGLITVIAEQTRSGATYGKNEGATVPGDLVLSTQLDLYDPED